jgi:hypothetical protein
MKNILFVAIAILFSSQVFAQASETKKVEAPTMKAEAKYCCPKCDYCSSKKGTCPHHKVELVKSESEVMYCCGNCGFQMTPVKGKCPESTTPVMKEGTLHCVLCYDKGGKCPKCGMEMRTIEVPKKKKAKK